MWSTYLQTTRTLVYIVGGMNKGNKLENRVMIKHALTPRSSLSVCFETFMFGLYCHLEEGTTNHRSSSAELRFVYYKGRRQAEGKVSCLTASAEC
jgi:hypothetical protein